MRSTRVMYVENDHALRQFLHQALSQHKDLEIIGSFAGSDEALDRALVRKADVALLDFGLETNGLNGIELGIALRTINEYIGIVIYSQYKVHKMFKRVPPSMRNGWSFFEKSGEMSADDYAKIIKETAVSKGNWEEFASLAEENADPEMNRYYDLSSRQRSIIALMAQGVSVQEIGTRLDLSYAYVRKELSRAYSVLLPDAQEGEDFKTLAILKYLQLAKSL
jgi:two-component system, NarL family, response regulator DesR